MQKPSLILICLSFVHILSPNFQKTYFLLLCLDILSRISLYFTQITFTSKQLLVMYSHSLFPDSIIICHKNLVSVHFTLGIFCHVFSNKAAAASDETSLTQSHNTFPASYATPTCCYLAAKCPLLCMCGKIQTSGVCCGFHCAHRHTAAICGTTVTEESNHIHLVMGEKFSFHHNCPLTSVLLLCKKKWQPFVLRSPTLSLSLSGRGGIRIAVINRIL